MSTNRKKRTTPATRHASAISDKVKVTVSLTADSAQKVEALAKELGVSKSELFERLTKEHLNQATPGEETTATLNVESSLKQKLASLISTKTQHQGTASYDALKNYLQEQDDLINVLEKRVLELHGLASFGESQLSKWRNRTFNG
ncbi:ribbon-helix-helix domain-containing protein [Planktothrix agardhii]|uniref:ribbon-helix-helix domain-containing protein n=1 Tax=Planktothrix agardhii TaxID=1160 RepID=UPI0003FBF733|nr:ribbon-helix-helix domain-containing protein [Planktothrix agardhii]